MFAAAVLLRNVSRPRQVSSSPQEVRETVMLFWPIVIALGPGFVALYYDHDVKAFDDQGACEQTLHASRTRAESPAGEGIHGSLGRSRWRPIVGDQMNSSPVSTRRRRNSSSTWRNKLTRRSLTDFRCAGMSGRQVGSI
jgi:hypothetical protein